MQCYTESAENTVVFGIKLSPPGTLLSKKNALYKDTNFLLQNIPYISLLLLALIKILQLIMPFITLQFSDLQKYFSYLNLHKDEVCSHAANHEEILCQLNRCKSFSRSGMGCTPIIRLQSLKVLVKV